jgi:predicted transposase YdaD
MISEKLILETDILMYEAEKRAEKREEKRAMRIAKNLLAAGMSKEQIAELTDLPLSKIRRLKKQ